MIYPLNKYAELLKIGLLMAILTLLCLKNNYSQELDYRAQSLFIYKFTKYIVWPENKLKGDFVIGVYGNSPLYDELVLMASLKKAGNDQNIVVKEVRDEDDLSGFHLIYVPASKSRQINGISEKVGDLPVVIVAEREGLARKGATINFIILENNVLKFEVNVDKLTRQKLSISDELLKLGFKV